MPYNKPGKYKLTILKKGHNILKLYSNISNLPDEQEQAETFVFSPNSLLSVSCAVDEVFANLELQGLFWGMTISQVYQVHRRYVMWLYFPQPKALIQCNVLLWSFPNAKISCP